MPPLPSPEAVAVILLLLRSVKFRVFKKISPPSPDSVAAAMEP
ncbi:hypothetical protein [Calothrix sp. CCY 0018]